MAMGYEEHEMVVLLCDDPEHGLEAGDIGTIVGVYERHVAFDVEFTRADGRPVAIITLTPDDVRPMDGEELLHARPVSRGCESRI